MRDIAHAIGYLAKLATLTVLATARTDFIVNGITGEHMTVAFFDIYLFIYIYIYIQGVAGGMDTTSEGCSLG